MYIVFVIIRILKRRCILNLTYDIFSGIYLLIKNLVLEITFVARTIFERIHGFYDILYISAIYTFRITNKCQKV